MVETGLDRVVGGDDALLRGKRLALVANPTAVDRSLRHAVDLFAERYDVVRLFGPEHGIRGDAQDMISVGDHSDPATGLEVVSLYGKDLESLMPRPEHLEGVDALVFDIQDVGSRYYTYVWTLVLCMRACARAGVEVIVLDRPNPLGGELVEGGAVEPGFESFVGLRSLPNRHGLTAAEIAAWARADEKLDLELSVVEMRGWQRAMYFGDTDLPWVMPSPNMPSLDTALVYPGMCLVEGTELSEGRGTTRPFEVAGAPFVDGHALAAALTAEDLSGVVFRPLGFLPMFQKHARVPCGGVQLHVTDRRAFRPYLTGVAFLRACASLWPGDFRWRAEPYEFEEGVPAIDLLAGSAALREGIEAGARLCDLAATWAGGERELRRAREDHLLYR